MAIRKDLDDMLNSLMDNSGSSAPARSHTTPRAARKSKFDDMSVDDLLHALEAERNHISADEPVADNSANDEQPAVWEFAPPPHDIPIPEPVSDDPSDEEEVPNIIAEVMHTEASAESTRVFDTIPMTEDFPKPTKKKKIVITGELPDYEALRREELEREKQAQRAAEAAAEEARAAERARRAAEAAAERQRLAEEAEQRRLAKIEEEKRLREEQEERARRIAEAAAEKKRLAEEAAAQRRAEEEAEQLRLAQEAEELRKAQEAAEKQRQIDEMKRLAEEAAAASEPTAVTFTEETIVNSSSADNTDPAIEALDEAVEGLSKAAEAHFANSQNDEEKPKKMGFFKKLMGKGKDENEAENAAETESAPEDGLFEAHDEPSATDLIDAAIAAINQESEKAPDFSDPVGDMLENIREDAAEAIADINAPKEEAAPAEATVLSDEDIIAGLTPDLKERFDELDPDKQQQVIEMRRAQLGAIAPPVEFSIEEAEELPEDDSVTEEAAPAEGAAAEPENAPETSPAENTDDAAKNEPVSEPQKPKGKVTSALGRILDEDPDELIAQRREHVETDSFADVARADKKKRLYTVLGIVMSVFAVIGIIATIAKGVGLFHRFTSGEVKKDSFTQMIYPAAIMDIEPFSDPSQLTSEQIITATIWSIIMDDSKISKYEPTLDTVSIPDVDVEKYAVELFGENLPAFEHATVGPLESRFYYSDGAYNVKIKPITHTYAPEIKTIVKNGSDYTLTVDYYDELPQWMDRTVAKQVEFKLTEKEDGTFRFSSMKIISVNSGNL
ncbi:MAG: hypothetical protein K6G33_11545 [Ruminococcus sp.]|uniref:hypothetical protein n=1 Tax=Ruminococcus sp. TaxID=41978 RepID=UPI0025CD90AB|nr:hypothetical protein [Ruminococcus sp.]MCR5601358.1 hypothetical protein [Ruminococcus sp.]